MLGSGVHSPTLSGTTQLDAYRPLYLPTILIGDSNLGGISSTIASYESLLLRGYIVDAVLLFRDEYYRNWEYLTTYFGEKGVSVFAVNSPPRRVSDTEKNHISTENYYNTIVPKDRNGGVFDILHHLDQCHTRRLEQLDSMPRRTLAAVWWPFVQHGLVRGDNEVTVIDSAWSDFFSVYRPGRDCPRSQTTSSETRTNSLLEPQFDGSASWWTQTLGHAHPSLAIAAARAAGRYGHVMFPQATHMPALKLAERLLHNGPGKGWASRVYFSDNGSTGMEIALKMALRAFTAKHGQALDSDAKKRLGILGLKGSYHGDTIGAMDACEEGVYTCEWHNAKGYWFEPPTVSIRRGRIVVALPSPIAAEYGDHVAATDANSLSWVYDIPNRLTTSLASIYRRYICRTLENLQKHGPQIAALVLEPLVMGAGGMIFVDPLFQRIMIDVVRGESPGIGWSGIPVIFDEVFVGLHRVGMQSTAALLGVEPDISVYAKTLTGGIVPLAVTLASDAIFKSFLSETKTDALLHGHSYTAHPIGCEVANETMDIVEKLSTSDSWKNAQARWAGTEGVAGANVWSFWDPDFVNGLSHIDNIAEIMTLGSVLAFKVKDIDGGQ
jgi:bifunctional dethiobiotin synthetase / adenosylmethionine---8-amino-7-oxononanoate aminotransferase